VTVLSSVGRGHVSPAVAAFMQRYPPIELELHFSDDWVDLRTTRTERAGRIGLLADSDLNRHSAGAHLASGLRKPRVSARHGRTDRPEDLLQEQPHRRPVAGRAGSRACAACSHEGL